MKKILLIGILAVGLPLIFACKTKDKIPFEGDYSVKMDLSYLDSTSAYTQVYVLLAEMVDSANDGSLIPYKISFSDTSVKTYYSDNQTFSYFCSYQKMNDDYYQVVLDKKDTIGLEIRDSNMLMVFPDDMAFLLTKTR